MAVSHPPAKLSPLDVLVCYGRGPISWWIRLFTCGPSHVAIAVEVPEETMGENSPPETLVFESTSLSPRLCAIQHKRISGVQAHNPYGWICQYPGKVYVMRFKHELIESAEEDVEAIYRRLGVAAVDLIGTKPKPRKKSKKRGTKYDWFGMLLAGSRIVKRIPCLKHRIDNRQAQFCVETAESLIGVALSGSGPSLDPGMHRPRDMVRALRRSRMWDEPRRLK